MDIRIRPTRLKGTLLPVDSKSHAHRLLIAAFLAELGEGGLCAETGRAFGRRVRISDTNKDIEATKACLEALSREEVPLLCCGESGSTLRFLLPLASVLAGEAYFSGEGRLPERPLEPLLSELVKHGLRAERSETEGSPSTFLYIKGRLKSGIFELPGNVSSQFITGLLLALPLLPGDSEIRVRGPLESAGYVDMTLELIREFGIEAEAAELEGSFVYRIPGGQRYLAPAAELRPEADWSSAAFWIAANALGAGNDVKLEAGKEKADLKPESSQRDREIVRLASLFEAARLSAETLEIDVSQVPDLLPVLSVLAASRRLGRTDFINAARLRIKESDRLEAAEEMINALGGRAEAFPDSLTVCGASAKPDEKPLSGGSVDGKNDHRIVMAAAVASTMCRGSVTIRGAEAAAKSYPRFWEDFRSLGGDYVEI